MLAVIGCGNPVRSDDGVGHQVVRRLMQDSELCDLEDIKIFDAGTNGMAVMYEARGCDALILVDACQSGSPAGSLFEVPGSEFDDEPPRQINSHGFRWDHALYAGRRIYAGSFPDEVTVFLVEAESLVPGFDLSESVQAASDQAVERIRAIMMGYTHIKNRAAGARHVA